ncbi:MAG: DUF294 nucleotidyltransferase-like domain-containing protein, partial [Kangiellaceae bacterium]|nr:DUF294 nucleotidyltransferase-like domain-containing protein [Kangiellaceae bacterium]
YNQPFLYIVRTGEYEIRDPEGRLIDRLAEGDQFGFPTLVSGKKAVNQLSVLKEGLIYRIPSDTFHQLKAMNKDFDIFYVEAYANRVTTEINNRQSNLANHNLAQPISSLIARKPVTVTHDISIEQAALIMTERGVSSVMVLDGENLVGIITDKDIRARLVARGQDPTKSVVMIMTENPQTVLETDSAEHVLATMLESNIHHLPVMSKKQELIGMITTSDLVQMQISHPLFLIGRIKKANRLEQLVKFSSELGNLLHQMIQSNTKVAVIGQTISLISDAINIRLIELAIKQLGEPPIKFCWCAFGSQGRHEQAANSDQDNGLILVREPTTEEAKYFQRLALSVNQGMDQCGFVLCPGDIMASNPKWCVSLDKWQDYFADWIESPEPKALMHASIFFDLRAIYGDFSLLETLQNDIMKRVKSNSIFLALLTQNALKTEVPIGFFKQFLLEKNGDQVPALDLKHKGLAPIVDIARIYALASGISAINTHDRLQSIDSRLLSKEDAKALLDCYRFVARIRYQHQLRCWQHGKQADNYVIPEQLSSLQRQQLKDAFNIVADSQAGLRMKFARGLF